jgi:hypothetical protein
MRGDLGLLGGVTAGRQFGKPARGEPHAGMLDETLGEVGEEVRENLSLTPLWAKDPCQHHPLRTRVHEPHGTCNGAAGVPWDGFAKLDRLFLERQIV